MKFHTEEHFYKYSPWLKAWEIIQFFWIFFLILFLYGKYLFDKIRGIKEPVLREQNIWLEHTNFGNIKLQSLALDNDESTKLLKSEALDFPQWEDWDDPYRSLLKFKSDPPIQSLEEFIFDEIELKTDVGIYLIRINEKGKGMTLCFLSATNKSLIDILDLKPLSWTIEEVEYGNIQVIGHSKKGKHVIKVKTDYNFK